jgi:hypothetical protein
MQGVVLYYSCKFQIGLIKNEMGERFGFTFDDWRVSAVIEKGMPVVFDANGRTAKNITLDETRPQTVGSYAAEAVVENNVFSEKLKALFLSGQHNKFGFTISLILLVSIFLPAFKIPILGTSSLVSLDMGNTLFALISAVAILFYGGATRLYAKIITFCIFGVLLLQYFNLATGSSAVTEALGQANQLMSAFGGRHGIKVPVPSLMDMVQWGVLVNLLACLGLIIALFKKGYSSNSKTI